MRRLPARLVGLLGGLAGGAALYRALRRRRRPEQLPDGGPDPRAAELRAKLAAAAETNGSAPAPELPANAAAEDPEARRRRVHEQGRAALEDMRRETD